MLWLAGCAAGRLPSATVPAGLVSVQDLCRKYNAECRWDGVSQTISVAYAGKSIQALVGTDVVVIGTDRVTLSAPLASRQGVVMAPADFERKVFGAGLPQEDYVKGAQSRRLGTVVIDAGHGGKDSGALGISGMKEKDVVLDVARRVKKAFEASGVQVLMTRDSDVFVTLADRTAMASRPDVDLFVSIHANANRARGANGIEVYYMGTFSREDRTEDQRMRNEKKLGALFNMRGDSPDIKMIVMDMLYEFKRAFSSGLSEAIMRGFQREMPRRNRGSKPGRFFVLRNTLIPAVLVEVGFVTNPKEAALLKDGAYRQRLADSITKSTLGYIYASGF
jgi:N-acetylmuramoyl-L-alanine amidase